MEPPRRKQSSPLVVREELADGAIHTLRPIQPMAERDTARPPPIPHDPIPVARPVPRVPTTMGMPVPAPRPKMDSYEVATDGLFDLVAEKNAELAAKDAELAAKAETIRAAEERAAKLRAELDAVKVVVEPAPPPDVPTHWQWRVLAYKLGGAVLAILVPLGVYVAYRVESLVPRVANTQQTVSVVEGKAIKGRDLMVDTLVFLAAWQAYQDCLNGQESSAIVRGTGHKIRSLPDPGTLWFEQNKPSNRPAPLWPMWSWSTVNDCGAEPHVPTLPP